MSDEKDKNPLISVVVITYNSSKYILETLESIKKQTYNKIELIVSDDSSTDDTLAICNRYINDNNSRFARTELITVESNTGIPANCNRGIKASKGSWIKFLAGDDTLKADCVSSYVDYCTLNKEICVIHSNCEYFLESFEPQAFIRTSALKSEVFNQLFITANEQYKLLLIRNRVIAPSIFIKREALLEIGGFDERLRLIDDLPLWLKFTRNGTKIYYLDKATVNYRKTDNSVTKNRKANMDSRFAKESLIFYRLYLKHEVSYIKGFRFKLGLKIVLFLNMINFNLDCGLSEKLFKLADRIMVS